MAPGLDRHVRRVLDGAGGTDRRRWGYSSEWSDGAPPDAWPIALSHLVTIAVGPGHGFPSMGYSLTQSALPLHWAKPSAIEPWKAEPRSAKIVLRCRETHTGELRLPVRRTRLRGRRGHRDGQGRGGAVGRGRRLRAGDQPDADRLRRRDGQSPRSGAPARAAAGGGNERGGAGPARGADRARPRRDEPRGDRALDHGRGGRGAERSRGGRQLGTAAGRIHEVGA
jgi:hypothetical protein